MKRKALAQIEISRQGTTQRVGFRRVYRATSYHHWLSLFPGNVPLVVAA